MTMVLSVSREQMDKLKQGKFREDLHRFLDRHTDSFYSVRGLMVKFCKVKVSEIDKNYKQWSQEHRNLYHRIRRNAKKLAQANKVVIEFDGKRHMFAVKK